MGNIFKVSGTHKLDAVLLTVRVSVALLMLLHGFPKLEKLLGPGTVEFPGIFGLSPTASLALAVFAEVGCSLFLLFGFATRLATIPLMLTMLVAVFYIHMHDPFARQELGLLYLLIYFILLVTGSGKYSADYMLQRTRVRGRQE